MITSQSGILNLLSSQIVSIKKQVLDPSTYTEMAEEMKWQAVEEEIKHELNDLFNGFKDEVVIMIDTKTSIIFKYKGSVASEAELPSEGNTVGDVYNVEDTGANYAWDGTKWDKLSETIDLSKFITVEDFQTAVQEAVQAEANVRAEADQTLSNTISGKVDKEIIGSNGKALIFNESDGGGAKFEFTNNHASFVGVNDDSNGIMAQIYAKDTTTNIGSRINVTKDGIYYTVKNNATYTAEDEIAVKKDLAELNTQIEEALNEIDIKTQSIFHYKGSVADTDALPTEDQEIGDVYNVEADGHNVAWNGTDWDKLSETIDLSKFITKEEVDKALEDINKRVETAEHALFEYEDPESGDYNAGLVSTVADLQVSFNDHETAINNHETAIRKITTDLNDEVNPTLQDHEQRIVTLEESGGGEGGGTVPQSLIDRVSTLETRIDDELFPVQSDHEDRIEAIRTELDDRIYPAQSDFNDMLNVLESTVYNNHNKELQDHSQKITTLDNAINKTPYLREMLDLLEKKINDLQKSDIEVSEIDGEGSFSSNMDYILSGTVTSQLFVSEAHSVLLKNTTVDNGVVNLYAYGGDIDIKNVTVNDPEQLGMSEAVFTINTDKYVTIRDCSFDIGSSYNGVQFDGMYSPKSILIDNVDFNGEYQYPIMVQSTDEDSVITISNCHFGQVNNVISLYNKQNKRFTLNIINCTCDSWGSPESEEDSFPWAGLVRCVDDVSGSAEAEIENNLYGKDKVTINIQNLTKPDGTKLTAPENMSTICGSMDATQILYVITTSQDIIPYDEDRYPTINII